MSEARETYKLVAPQTWTLPESLIPVAPSKLMPPVARPDSVVRRAIIERLTAHSDVPVVTAVAPAGYGKTTLMQQWAERDVRRFIWLELDKHDNDPAVLLTGLALAINTIVPMDEIITSLSARLHPSSSVLIRLLSALDRTREPCVLVLDDVHSLDNAECRDAVAAVVDRLPATWQAALVGRSQPWQSVARLRAEGRVVEIEARDLAMDDHEASTLLTATGVELKPSDIAALNRRAEGWPVALSLAALAITSDPDLKRGKEWPGGRDRFMVDYLKSEVLSRLPASAVEFLTRTSLPPRLCGPLCDALLRTHGSADQLSSLEQANALVVSTDHERLWYRYHHLFRELLSAELHRREPDRVRVLRRRAADWYEANGSPELAVDEAMKLNDAARVARIAAESGEPLYQSGHAATTRRWFDWIDQRALMERYPRAAVTGAWVHLLAGRAAAGERWIAAAERGAATVNPGPDNGIVMDGELALLRAASCPHGVDRMRRDAEAAVRLLQPGTRWWAAGLVMLGTAHLLANEPERAETVLKHAHEVAEDSEATVFASVALAERAQLAERRGQVHEWERLADLACSIIAEAALEDHPMSALAFAVNGRARIGRGDALGAKTLFASAQRLRPYLTHALPVYAIQTRLELASGYVSLTDVSGARTVLREALEILRRRSQVGVLVDEISKLRHQLDALHANMVGASSLTSAELRLLPLLATHLSFRQIGERLFISSNTVKTEAISIYRKLGVSSRGEAIERVRALGLLASGDLDISAPFIPSG